MKRTRKGFTLIELLIVIAILGALTAMMQLSSTGATASAKAASIVNGLQTLRTAASIYIAENSAGSPTATGFSTNSADYIDGITFDTIKTQFVIESDDSDGPGAVTDKWFAKYTLSGSYNTTEVIKKLKDRAVTDLLFSDKGTTSYTSGTEVYLQLH